MPGRDIRQIEAVAREFEMDPRTRREFGDYVELEKRQGRRGTKANGDFTYEELQKLAAAFLNEEPS